MFGLGSLRSFLLTNYHIRVTRHLSVVSTTIDVAANVGTKDILLVVVGGAIYGRTSSDLSVGSIIITGIVAAHIVTYSNLFHHIDLR